MLKCLQWFNSQSLHLCISSRKMCLKGERPKINFKTLKSIKTQDDNSFISCVSVDMQILNKKGGRWWCRCWWRSVSWRGYRGLPNQIGGELSELFGSQPGSEQHQPTPSSTQHSNQQQIYFILRIWDSVKLEACVYCSKS